MLRSLIAIALVLVLGAGAGAVYWTLVMQPSQQAAAQASQGVSRGPVSVEVAQVRVGPATTTADAVGTLRSYESIELRPEVPGRVARINFTEGSDVRAGDLLVELDNSVERANVAKAEAELQLAQTNFDRAQGLRRSNAGTQRALDEADAALRIARTSVDLAEAALAKRILKAPFDARAGLREVSLGEYLGVGDEIVNLEQIDPLRVDFRIPEIFLPSIRSGQPIAVQLDSFPGREFVGEVSAINPLVDEAGRAIVIRARIENDDRTLRPGQFARVQLTLQERADAVFVPETALFSLGPRQLVYRVVDGAEGEGKLVRQVEVRLGKRLAGEAEIVSGLSAQDVVVTAGTAKLREGAKIQPVPGAGGPIEPEVVVPTAQRAVRNGDATAARAG